MLVKITFIDVKFILKLGKSKRSAVSAADIGMRYCFAEFCFFVFVDEALFLGHQLAFLRKLFARHRDLRIL